MTMMIQADRKQYSAMNRWEVRYFGTERIIDRWVRIEDDTVCPSSRCSNVGFPNVPVSCAV